MDADINRYMQSCELCPRRCKVNRNNIVGRCGQGSNIKIGLSTIHYYEEPCISGFEENEKERAGSGAIFFSGCNLNCIFCQNYKISSLNHGNEISVEGLANEMIRLQSMGANNINLVTAFAYIPHIIKSIDMARSNGLHIPIVYNSSGYENVESIQLLNGYVDVYLPDMKYYFSELSKELSNCENYFKEASISIKEMYKQVGKVEFGSNGLITKGVIIRHLVLPNHIYNSKKVLKWIKDTFDDNVLASVMFQYFPIYKAMENEDINRKVNKKEYDEIIKYMEKINIKIGYIQEYSEIDESIFVPDFK